MDQVKSIYKISQILSQAFKEVNDVCAHLMAEQSIQHEQPKHVEKKPVQQKTKEKSAPVQESQPKKENQPKKESQPKKETKVTEEKIQQQKPKISQPVQQTKPKTQAKQQNNAQKDKSVSHPDKPKQPLSAFFIFQQQQKENVKKLHPSSGVTDISKMMGEIWRGLQQSEKAPYLAKSQQLKARYEKDLKKFYERHPEQKSKKQLKREKAQSKGIEESKEAPVTKAPAKQASKPAKKTIVIEEENSESV